MMIMNKKKEVKQKERPKNRMKETTICQRGQGCKLRQMMDG